MDLNDFKGRFSKDVLGIIPLSDGRYRIAGLRFTWGRSPQFVRGTIIDVRETNAQTEQLLSSASRSNVSLVVPRHSALIRTTRLPTTDGSQIGKMASHEAMRQFRGTLADLQIGWQALSKRADGSSDILMVAVPSEFIAQHIAALRPLGIRISRVTTTLFVWPRVPQMIGEDSTGAYYWEHAGLAEYVHLQESAPVFSRGAIDEQGALDFVEETAQLDSRHHANGSAPICLRILSDTPQYTEHSSASYSAVVVTTSELSMTKSSVPSSDLLCIAGAADLIDGLPEMDLLPVHSKRQLALKRTVLQLAKLTAHLVWLIILLLACAEAAIFRYESQSSLARTRISELQSENASLATDSDKLRVLRLEEDRVNSPLYYLSKIYDATPPEISISSFQYDARGTCQLGGEADSYSEIMKYMERLKEPGILEDLKLVYCRSGDGGSVSLVSFKMLLVLSRGPNHMRQEPSS